MATQYIYNGFGDYDTHPFSGEKGITLRCNGVDFFFPYQKVRAIPDWTFRDLDHKESAQLGVTHAVYTTHRLTGQQVVNILLESQIPVKYSDMGMVVIGGKATGQILEAEAGIDEAGTRLTVSIQEKEATKGEVAEAERLSHQYKMAQVQEYYYSKRQAMIGKPGHLSPVSRVRTYMDELGLEDIDDVKEKQVGGLDPAIIAAIAEAVMKAGEVKAVNLHEAVESVRKAGKAQLAPGKPKSLNLAERAAEYDRKMAEKEVVK